MSKPRVFLVRDQPHILPRNKKGRVDTKCYALSRFSTVPVVRGTRQTLFVVFKGTRKFLFWYDNIIITEARLGTLDNGDFFSLFNLSL